MPRQSAEARSAAAFRQGGKHPVPPKHLSDDAKALWREMVEDRPVDYFRPGALHYSSSWS
jgi:phage terminase small subunit